MDKIVLLKAFGTREEAAIANSLLDSAGIKVIVKSDDAAGFYPQMDLSIGVKLFVDESNFEEAEDILKTFPEDESKDA